MLRAGVDLGGTKIQTVIVDEQFLVIGSDHRPTPLTGGPKDVAAAVVSSIYAAIRDAGKERADVTMIGVGAPGQIDTELGTVTSSGTFADWTGPFPLAPLLAHDLDRQVTLGNDVHVAIQAEARVGAGRSFPSFLGVYVGTGVGGAVVLGGELWTGRGAAGEIGHVVVERNGRECTCGRFGCLEAYAGRAAMEAAARRWIAEGRVTSLFDMMEAMGQRTLTSGVWSAALQAHDPMAIELIEDAVDALGVAVASAINLLDVDGVVIGGGLGVRLGDGMVDRIREHAGAHLLRANDAPEFRVATLGELGGAIGAAMLPEPSDSRN